MSRVADDTIARLERQNAELALMADLLLALGRTLDLPTIRREVLNVAVMVTGAGRVRLALRAGDRWEAWTLVGGQEVAGEWTPSALTERLVEAGEPMAVVGDDGAPGPDSYLGVPLRHEGAIVGVLEVEDLPVADRLDDYVHTLSLVAGTAVLALENARLHERVRQANEMLGGYLQMVSHDLRSPLTSIQGHAQLLLRRLDRAGSAGPERRSAETIASEAKRMNVMIQDLVDSARFEAGQVKLELQPVSLAFAIYDLIERARGIMDVERVVIETPADLLPVNADPNRLERILINLISNGLKYSDPATLVVVKAESRGAEVVVSIADRGPGIPPEDRPRIFERFFRGTGARRAEGIGLGLYGTRLLVEAHGGRIWFESEPGQGSTFFFTLPLA